MKLKNQPFIVVALGLIFFIADRILKYLFFDTATINYGIAFGITIPNYILITLLVIINIIIAVWLISSWKAGKRFEASLISLIILGSASNIIDRIKFGYVIDYIDIKVWPVFNIADVLIVLGTAMLLIKYYKENKKLP
jgi:signal peptidase II